MLARSVVLSAFALLLAAPPVLGQADSWQGKWYWGAGGGIYAYNPTGSTGRQFAVTAGGHWLITGKRSGLFIAFDQILFPDSSVSAVADPSAAATGGIRAVDFSRGRRIQATVLAIPMDRALQVMVGGGFVIHQVTDAAPRGPFTTMQDAVNASNAVAEVDTKAFFAMAVGAQYRFGRWAVFGNYNYMPSSSDFLITSDQHTLTAGIRYALTNSHEEVTTER